MEREEELHSFIFIDTIDGVEHSYRITQNDEKYGVEKDGIVIAEVAHSDHWQQVSGKPLTSQLQERIYNQIESHYD